jgi:hypothetical protein
MPTVRVDVDTADWPPGAFDRYVQKLVDESAAFFAAMGLGAPARGVTLRPVIPTLAERLAEFAGPGGERHLTRTGRVVNRFAPSAQDWDIEALAWSQANLARYGGEMYAKPDESGHVVCAPFYSTAEHQINAMRAVDILHPGLKGKERARLRVYAGVHDFVEVRLSDLISQVKKLFPDYKDYEHFLERSFFEAGGVDPSIPAEVDAIDKRLVVNEGPSLFPATGESFWRDRSGGREPIPGIVVPNPEFVVRVRPSAEQLRAEPEIGDDVAFWSFPPLVASTLVRELNEARAELAS